MTYHLEGQRFGRLTVVKRAGALHKSATWTVHCDCGTEKIVNGRLLRNGQTRSCGCFSRETTAARNVANTKHGGSYSPEYRAWRNMKDRCQNPKNIKFALYGGRGIKVCDRWDHSFEKFLADVGPRPSSGHSVDRFPNGDGDYAPGNVRWATASEQNSNRRTYTRRRAINPKEPQHGRA